MISNMPIELHVKGETRGKLFYVLWVDFDDAWHRSEEISASAFHEGLYSLFGLFTVHTQVL